MRKNSMLTTTEAHQLTGLSTNQLSSLCKKGRIAGEKRGRDWFIDRASLLAYMRAWHPEIAQKIEEGSAGA